MPGSRKRKIGNRSHLVTNPGYTEASRSEAKTLRNVSKAECALCACCLIGPGGPSGFALLMPPTFILKTSDWQVLCNRIVHDITEQGPERHLESEARPLRA